MTSVADVNNVAYVKKMNALPRLFDLIRGWWKDHSYLHKIKPDKIKSRPAAPYRYELISELDIYESSKFDPAFGFKCTCCGVWWITVRNGVMSWANYREGDLRHKVKSCSVADPRFLECVEHALKTIYHEG